METNGSFFRDYYNFYKDLDDDLTQGLGSRNVFLGLNDVTSLNPKTPVRMTNKDVGKHINYLYLAKLHERSAGNYVQ